MNKSIQPIVGGLTVCLAVSATAQDFRGDYEVITDDALLLPDVLRSVAAVMLDIANEREADNLNAIAACKISS